MGNTFSFVVPAVPGLSGTSLFVQAASVSALAANGKAAVTDAHEIQSQ